MIALTSLSLHQFIHRTAQYGSDSVQGFNVCILPFAAFKAPDSHPCNVCAFGQIRLIHACSFAKFFDSKLQFDHLLYDV